MRRLKRATQRIVFDWLTRHPAVLEQLVQHGLSVLNEMPIAPTHYYSPLPDIPKVRKKLARWYREIDSDGLDWSLDGQVAFVERLEAYAAECESLPAFADVTSQGYGPGYGEVEAQYLHCMIRYLKPRRIIEVGSGVSTYFTMNAARLNAEAGHPASLVCIEPYPTTKLLELVAQKKVVLRVEEVQDAPIELFRELEEGDILFIDSSHVSKVDSDVNWLYLSVLPQLKRGVVIHIHDIPFPYLTFMPEHPLFTFSLLWNEAAVVRAFLMYNRAFDVLMCQSYLHHKRPDVLKRVVRLYDKAKHFPASLWLVKTA